MSQPKIKPIREILAAAPLVGFNHLPADTADASSAVGPVDSAVKSSVAKSGKGAVGNKAFIRD